MYERSHTARTQRIRKSNKNKRKKWIKNSLIILTLLLVGFGGYFWYNLAKGYDDETRNGKKDIDMKSEPFTVLFVGVDQYSSKEEKEGIRTDVLMLAAVNPKTKSVKLVSIPRDTYTTIPNTNGHKDKINSASFWAQRKKINPMLNAKLAVENLLHVPVDYYAKINFIGFTKLVDAVGGVDVNVPFDFKIATFGNRVISFQKGPMHLNGIQALPYVRMRYQDPENDAGRNKRQQEVVSQVIDKLTSPIYIHKIPEVLDIIGDNISYDIKVGDFVTLANTWRKIPKENIETIQFDKQHGLIEDYIPLNGLSRNFVYKLTDKERIRISNILRQQLELPLEQTSDDSSKESRKDNYSQKSRDE